MNYDTKKRLVGALLVLAGMVVESNTGVTSIVIAKLKGMGNKG